MIKPVLAFCVTAAAIVLLRAFEDLKVALRTSAPISLTNIDFGDNEFDTSQFGIGLTQPSVRLTPDVISLDAIHSSAFKDWQ